MLSFFFSSKIPDKQSHIFHKNIQQSEKQINILDLFLKDHVILKTFY